MFAFWTLRLLPNALLAHLSSGKFAYGLKPCTTRWRESNISLMVTDLLDEDMLFEASIRRAVASTNTAPAKVNMHTAE